MLPTFGREPRLGTNPIAIAVPCAEEPPFVYDAATTVVAANKLETSRRMGALLPPGILAEDDGTPIMEPIPAPASFSRMLPLGSTPELASHKGYGLACAVEILTNVLGGLTFSARLPRHDHNHCVAALDVAVFSDPAEFKRAMDDFARMLKATSPAPGHERVLVPGQLEWEAEQERRANGIPLHPDVAAWLDRA
jgi:L-2-hydroxycarboxylate dehydrogenase (NAD+)